MSEYDSLSQPVEVYRFEVKGGGSYYYTTDDKQVVASSVPYTTLKGLKRSQLQIPTSGEPGALSVSMPADGALARLCALFETPTEVKLTLKRYQRDDLNTPVLTFVGLLNNADVKGDVATLVFPSSFSVALEGNIPRDRVQQQCNWQVYDSNCKYSNGARYKGTGATLNRIRLDAGTIYIYQIQGRVYGGAMKYGDLAGGTLKITTGSKIETRTLGSFILYPTGDTAPNYDSPIVDDQLLEVRLNTPLTTYGPTSSWEVSVGCDNSPQRCGKLNNLANYGGFPYVPTEKLNPFRVDYSKAKKA